MADIVESAHRGRAYGVYNMTIGILALPASVIAGVLWDKISPAAPFYFGAILSAVATGLLFLLIMRKKKTSLLPRNKI